MMNSWHRRIIGGITVYALFSIFQSSRLLVGVVPLPAGADRPQKAVLGNGADEGQQIYFDLDMVSSTITSTKTGSDDHQHLCPQSLVTVGGLESPPTHVWNHLKGSILNATYFSHPEISQTQLETMHTYTQWIDDLYAFYIASRLRRSVANPAPPKFISHLLKLAHEVRAYNNAISSTNEKRRTIRVLVLGGSVTSGHGCTWPSATGIPNPRGDSPSQSCAWPARLESLLNQVLFEGEHIFQVDNIASGGQTSEWGAMVLEYRLFRDQDHLPDIVISSFSANEAKEPDYEEKVFVEYMQKFVKAAQSLHPCNDNAPLIVMADDFYGDMPYQAMRQTANVYMLSTWNNLMAVNFASILKFKVIGEYVNATTLHPLTGSSFNVHLGVSFHIGMAWAVMFNMVNSIVNVCNDEHMNQLEDPGASYVTPKHWGDFNLGKGDHATTNLRTRSTSTGKEDKNRMEQVDTTNAHNNSAKAHSSPLLEEIEPQLLQTLNQGEPPFKHFGPMQKGNGWAQGIATQLKQNMADNHKLCNGHNDSDHDPSNKQKKKCTFAWVVNPMTGPFRKQELKPIMDHVIFFNEGWDAAGLPIQQPRTGWYGNGENASFSMKLENVTVDTNFVILLTMKSYGPKFLKSKLAVLPSVVKGPAAVMTRDFLNNRTVDFENDAVFLIDGYHDTKTSVHFPHKVMIPGGAKVGDSIILDAKIVGGSHFKIAGLAFCSF